jgi:aminoglycoside 3-N-acetyltransferase
MGLTNGATVLMHSSFNVHNGLQGTPQKVIDSVLTIIGPSGNLVMVSMPYGGTSFAYLKDRPIFDVRRTPSRMGIITELFRTHKNVLRSLSPSHPILAFGPKAEWIIADHEKTMYPCGRGSPFEKILKLKAKTLLFDMTSCGISTFFHHVEDTFKEHLPIKLYDNEPFEATVVDSHGNRIKVNSYVFSSEARRIRDHRRLKSELLRSGGITSSRIGNTNLTLIDLNAAVDCARKIVESGNYLYGSKSFTIAAVAKFGGGKKKRPSRPGSIYESPR